MELWIEIGACHSTSLKQSHADSSRPRRVGKGGKMSVRDESISYSFRQKVNCRNAFEKTEESKSSNRYWAILF